MFEPPLSQKSLVFPAPTKYSTKCLGEIWFFWSSVLAGVEWSKHRHARLGPVDSVLCVCVSRRCHVKAERGA